MAGDFSIQSIRQEANGAYLNQDVRVTYKRDVQITVANLPLDAKQGDTAIIPRWLAKLLLAENAIEIQGSDIATYISRTLNRERISSPHELAVVDVDFYIRVTDYIKGLSEKERDNLIVALNSFTTGRVQKIVKLAAATPLAPEIAQRLTAEERELYRTINNASACFKKGVLKEIE
jgi:DNA replication factor GINS